MNSSESHAVYVASPLGFTAPTRAYYYEVLLPAIRARGIDPLDPWQHDDEAVRHVIEMSAGPSQDDAWNQLALPLGKSWRPLKEYLGNRNADLIDGAEAVFAVLDGTDVDSGTAAEIGYAAALGKPVVGWRTDLRLSADNADALVNLQVEYFILRNQGGYVGRDYAAALDALSRIVGIRAAGSLSVAGDAQPDGSGSA